MRERRVVKVGAVVCRERTARRAGGVLHGGRQASRKGRRRGSRGMDCCCHVETVRKTKKGGKEKERDRERVERQTVTE